MMQRTDAPSPFHIVVDVTKRLVSYESLVKFMRYNVARFLIFSASEASYYPKKLFDGFGILQKCGGKI